MKIVTIENIGIVIAFNKNTFMVSNFFTNPPSPKKKKYKAKLETLYNSDTAPIGRNASTRHNSTLTLIGIKELGNGMMLYNKSEEVKFPSSFFVVAIKCRIE